MPFYEYECQACKYYAEVMQKITDAPLIECPSCGKRALKKLVSAPVFRLKGAGWYETDFKSDQENKRNLHGAEKEAPKAEAKTEAATDTKAAEKEAKEAKPTEAKAAAGGTETQAARSRRSTPAPKAARTGAAHKAAKRPSARRARRGRR